MPLVKEGYFITKQAYTRFKKWLVDKNLTVNKFAKQCGVSRQYLEQVLKGNKKITSSVLETFKKGGYEMLWK